MVIFIVLVGCALCVSPFLLRAYTDWQFGQAIYSAEKVPEKPVAIIFGAQVYRSGRLSPMLRDRVAAGAELYLRGKVEKLLLTGHREEASSYDEPAAMRRYAMSLGVPEEALILDPLGLRTYDSCYRARAVFAIDTAILVTQAFHLDRALMLCVGLGIDAVGVAADDQRPEGYSSRTMRWHWLREVAATTVAAYDLIRRPEPSLERGEAFIVG